MSESPSLEVLIVDDTPSAAARLSRLLHRLPHSIRIMVVEDYDAARDALLQHRCLVFLDLVLDDDNVRNHDLWDGLALLEDIATLDLTGELPVVILTQYPRPDDQRLAFLRHHVLDYLTKSVEDDDLLQAIRDRLTAANYFGLDIEIILDGSLTWHDMLLRATRSRILSAAAVVAPEVAEQELEHLVRGMFSDSSRLTVKELTGGLTASSVVRVQRFSSDGERASDAVVKIGEKDHVAREHQGWMDIRQFLSGTRSTVVEDYRHGLYLGALRYSFVGGLDRELVPFPDFYAGASSEMISRSIHQLFGGTCHLFYAQENRRYALAMDVDRSLTEHLGLDREALSRGVEFKFGYVPAVDAVYRPRDMSIAVPNVVGRYLAGRISIVADSFTCRGHGDLHGGNLLVDPDDGANWLIDFGGSGFGHWTRDFVTLECHIRYQLMRSADGTAQYALERWLLDARSLDGPSTASLPVDSEVRKAAATIATIRRAAAELIEARDKAMAFREYEAAVILTSLKYLQLPRLLKERWRKDQVMMTAGVTLEFLGIS